MDPGDIDIDCRESESDVVRVLTGVPGGLELGVCCHESYNVHLSLHSGKKKWTIVSSSLRRGQLPIKQTQRTPKTCRLMRPSHLVEAYELEARRMRLASVLAL